MPPEDPKSPAIYRGFYLGYMGGSMGVILGLYRGYIGFI